MGSAMHINPALQERAGRHERHNCAVRVILLKQEIAIEISVNVDAVLNRDQH